MRRWIAAPGRVRSASERARLVKQNRNQINRGTRRILGRFGARGGEVEPKENSRGRS